MLIRKIVTVILVGLLLSCSRKNNGEKILTLAMEDELITLDPYLHDDSITHSILSNIFDGLVAFDRDMKVEPALAIRWENPDDLTWKFSLRPGVFFHDGRSLTALDVKYSLERARNGKVCHYLSTLEQVNVIDSLTIEIKTSKPSPILLNKLTFISIIPEGMEDPVTRPVGTGPYRFVKYIPGDQIELKSYDRYWKGKPAIKRAVFKIIPQEKDRLQALLDGRVQLIRDVDNNQAEQNKMNPKVYFVSSPGLGVSMLGINFIQGGPLAKRKVREAIYWAIDPREAIKASGWDALPIDQLVSPYIVGYNPEIKSIRPDYEKAKKCIRDAGYPGGFDMTLEMSKTAASTTGDIVAKQLAKIGIMVKVKGQDWPDFSNRLYQRSIPFFMVGWSCSSGDASDIFDACLHSSDDKNYGSANWGNYSNRELDRLIEKSNQILDNKERIDLLKQAMLLAMSEFPFIPIFARNRIYGVDKAIAFSPRQDGRIKVFEIYYKL
jgi:peptide/nickel transport system substrate-binding protein